MGKQTRTGRTATQSRRVPLPYFPLSIQEILIPLHLKKDMYGALGMNFVNYPFRKKTRQNDLNPISPSPQTPLIQTAPAAAAAAFLFSALVSTSLGALR